MLTYCIQDEKDEMIENQHPLHRISKGIGCVRINVMLGSITTLDTPAGPLWISGNAQSGIIGLGWGKKQDDQPDEWIRNQLKDYFNKAIQHFESKVNQKGTFFQLKVWSAISCIPYGQVITYAQLAQQVGSHPRAVAQACGQNKVPIVVPCHRVIASNGTLGGYSAGQGLATKITLLQLEGVQLTGLAMQPHTVRLASQP